MAITRMRFYRAFACGVDEGPSIQGTLGRPRATFAKLAIANLPERLLRLLIAGEWLP
jgi:hypothetical protein